MNYIVDTSEFEVFKGTDNKNIKGYRVKYKNEYYKDRLDSGGFVESKNNLSQDGNCRIIDQAACIEEANISQNACVRGESIIMGRARIYGNATIGDCDVTEYELIYHSARISGDSLIGGRVHVTSGVIYNSIITGDKAYITAVGYYAEGPVGVIDCELSGSIHFHNVHLIKNIKSDKNLLFGKGACVLDNDEYFFMEMSNITICVYRFHTGNVFLAYSPGNGGYGDYEWNEFYKKRHKLGIEGIDEALASLIVEKVEKVVLPKWSCIRNGVHYKFKILRKGDYYRFYNENRVSSDEVILISVDQDIRQPLDINDFKNKTGDAISGIPSNIIDQAIRVLFQCFS